MLVELDWKPLVGGSCLSPRKYFILAIFNFESKNHVRDETRCCLDKKDKIPTKKVPIKNHTL